MPLDLEMLQGLNARRPQPPAPPQQGMSPMMAMAGQGGMPMPPQPQPQDMSPQQDPRAALMAAMQQQAPQQQMAQGPFQIRPGGNGQYAVVDIRTGQVRYSGTIDGARQAQAQLGSGR